MVFLVSWGQYQVECGQGVGVPLARVELLEIAERVITACSEDKLNEDMKECQSLCHSRMCCFEESGSDYSCQLDTSKNCAVYAGCEALVEDILVGGAEEDEA